MGIIIFVFVLLISIKYLNSIAEIFGNTDNFHRCRDKFPSILEI